MNRQNTVKTLGELVSRCKTEQKDLIEQKAKLDMRLGKLDSEIESLTHSMKIVENAPDNFVSTPQSGTLTEQVTNLIEQVLSESGPLHRKELLKIALESGIVFGSDEKDQLNTFMSYLSRDDRFKSDGRGVWRLIAAAESVDPENKAEVDEEGGVLLRMPRQMQ